MLNKVILIGRLGKDPESRSLQGGDSVCNFSIATDESYKDRSGEKQKRTEWHNIVAWKKLGEICQQYLKKGSLVYLEGRINTEKWRDKSTNAEREAKKIVINHMKILEGKRDDAGPSSQPAHDHGDDYSFD